jgi:hypothetical protein
MTTPGRFAYTPVPEKRLDRTSDSWSTDDAVRVWAHEARSRGMEPTDGPVVVVVDVVDWEIQFVEGEVES